MMIDVIRPDVFKPFPSIKAFFTLSNRNYSNTRSRIEGLNFGMNTDESISVIEQNKSALANHFDIDPNSYAIAEQVHKDHIEVVEEPDLYRETDGLITRCRNLVLGIQVADCAAVFVADVENEIIGVFHAGWRGAAANIVSKGVKIITSMAENPPRFAAYIGPCISVKNFEVGTEVASQFPAGFVDFTSFKKPHVDLKAYLRAELIESGVNERCIEVSDKCTVDDSQFYSYRRERDKAGRMLACMYLNKKTDIV